TVSRGCIDPGTDRLRLAPACAARPESKVGRAAPICRHTSTCTTRPASFVACYRKKLRIPSVVPAHRQGFPSCVSHCCLLGLGGGSSIRRAFGLRNEYS